MTKFVVDTHDFDTHRDGRGFASMIRIDIDTGSFSINYIKSL